jgi:hypothetical protein
MAQLDLSVHAETVRGVLAILGTRPRLRIGLMLQGLGLSGAEADSVVEHGLAAGYFEVDPSEPSSLRAVQRGRTGPGSA